MPAVIKSNDLLPKEKFLLEFCAQEIATGRKTLLYVRQTGRRNIQPRLTEVLARANLRALILPDTVQAIRRERWIKQNMHLLDVLSTNAKKVETGINLVDFANIVCYEIEYSLYTLLQAMFRVWRLGQTRPVQVIFPLYQDTLEQQAFYLMSSKISAARLLYGDNASGAFTSSNDFGGNLLQELAKRIVSGQLIQSNGLTTLLTANNAQTSEWQAITTPTIQAPKPLVINGYGSHNEHHMSTHTDKLFDEAFTNLFATISNPKEKRQRDAGQIGLFA